LKTATTGISDLEKKIADLQSAIAFFESKLPQEKEIDKILQELWQMAEANALQTKTIKTLKSERAGGYSEQPIQMTLSGDFHGFYSFLLQLEKLSRITRVSQLKLEKITTNEGEMICAPEASKPGRNAGMLMVAFVMIGVGVIYFMRARGGPSHAVASAEVQKAEALIKGFTDNPNQVKNMKDMLNNTQKVVE